MADIKFTAFIEDTVRSQSGGVFVLKTSEPHRRQVNGEWVTESRTFRDVKASRESGLNLDTWQKGDRVEITGSEKTEVRNGTDRKYYSLIVWADSITRAGEPRTTVEAHRWDVPVDDTPPEDPWGPVTPIPGDETPW